LVAECPFIIQRIVGSIKYMVSDNMFPVIIIETCRAH